MLCPHGLSLLCLPGSFLVCSQRREDVDVLWMMDNDSFPFYPSLAEVQVGVSLLLDTVCFDARVCCIKMGLCDIDRKVMHVLKY